MKYNYNGINYEVYTGPKGGLYILINSRKKYIKSNSNKIKQEENVIRKKVKCCCVCGNELTKTDTDYYDLTDYCARCALADGIIESLE